MCCCDSLIVEVARDLAEAPSSLALSSDVGNEVRRENLRPSSLGRRYPCVSPPPLGEQSLELVDGDESRSPRHLDRFDQWEHAAVEGGAAHAERCGRLRARVGESLDTRRFSNDFD